MTTERTPLISEWQCRQRYRAFYENPAIIEMGKDKAWTMSTSSKMPVSQHALLSGEGLRGASTHVPEDMLTLDELVREWPDATNNALYLRDHGRFAIIDVEPTATDRCKQIMLSTPWLYAEVSMSGHGYHIVIDYPEKLLQQYPNARKSTSKHDTGTYELHLQHWVTFTRRAIARPKAWGTISVEDALKHLCAQQRAPIVTHTERVALIERDSLGRTPQETLCMEGLPEWWTKYANGSGRIYLHTPQHTEGDLSKRDFRFAMYIAHRFIDRSHEMGYSIPDFDELFEVTYRTLCWALVHQNEWRDKNDSIRGGMTYLEMTCQRAVEVVLNDVEDTSADQEGVAEDEGAVDSGGD